MSQTEERRAQGQIPHDQVSTEKKRRTKFGPAPWKRASLVGVVLLNIAFTAIYSDRTDKTTEAVETNNQKFCALLAVTSDGPPATTPQGRELKDRSRALQHEFNCPRTEIEDAPPAIPVPQPGTRPGSIDRTPFERTVPVGFP